MRIAFLTNEFVIEKPDAGGLGNYLNRITSLLYQQGHEIEIFVTRHKLDTPKYIDFNGVKVYHVPVQKGKIFNGIAWLDKYFIHADYGGGLAYNIGVPLSLSKALEKRHKEAPFNMIQSANVAFTGLFIKRMKTRLHMTRLSSIMEEWMVNDGYTKGIGFKLLIFLNKIAIRNADVIYSPSIYSAVNHKGLKDRKVHVIRPPFFIENELVDISKYNLPNRYFIHYGSIGSLKGSDIIAKALPLVWDKIPEFRMVWAGREREHEVMKIYKQIWKDNSNKVIWFDGLVKNELYAALKQAEVSVLPSKVDNLPNTVLESLLMSVPVIGSNGASIDELVGHKKNGALVEIGNVKLLAETMINAWNNKETWLDNGFENIDSIKDFYPSKAVDKLVELYEKSIKD